MKAAWVLVSNRWLEEEPGYTHGFVHFMCLAKGRRGAVDLVDHIDEVFAHRVQTI